jgi:hypothetical protein
MAAAQAAHRRWRRAWQRAVAGGACGPQRVSAAISVDTFARLRLKRALWQRGSALYAQLGGLRQPAYLSAKKSGAKLLDKRRRHAEPAWLSDVTPW